MAAYDIHKHGKAKGPSAALAGPPSAEPWRPPRGQVGISSARTLAREGPPHLDEAPVVRRFFCLLVYSTNHTSSTMRE